MPRISLARCFTSSIDLATLTPPPLPRPPAWICALTTQTGPPSDLAAFAASSTVNAGMPRGTGIPYLRKISLPWYSWIFTAASPLDYDTLAGRKRKDSILPRFEPGIFRQLLIAIRTCPLIVVQDDDAARHHSVEQRVQRSNLGWRLVEIDVQISDRFGRLSLEDLGYVTLEDLDLPVSLELPAHPVLQPRTMLCHRVMQHPLLVLEQVVEPEIPGKVLAAQIVDNRLDAHAGVGAAFDE